MDSVTIFQFIKDSFLHVIDYMHTTVLFDNFLGSGQAFTIFELAVGGSLLGIIMAFFGFDDDDDD